MTRRRRPRKRHWSRDSIGDDSWWKALRHLGVSQSSVETTLDNGGGRETIDPHHVRAYGSPAERAATYLLLATYVPTYASLMYVAHVWSDAGRSLKEWIVAQYASLIDDGTEAQRKAALYSLWVDYFEVPARARFVFPRLAARCRRLDAVIAASGPVPWDVKRAVYREAALIPPLHAALAEGLHGSFFDVFGSVDPPEARELFRSITVADEVCRAGLEAVTTQPVRWQLIAVITVDETDERWTKWIPERETESSCLVVLVAEGRPTWVSGSDLLCEGRRIGRLAHYGFPFDPEIRHHVHGGPGDGQQTVLFRLAGGELAARAAVGKPVEAWPAGLGPHLAG